MTGKKKAEVVNAIVTEKDGSFQYPAAHVKPVYGSLDWYIDREAGYLL